MSSPPLQEPPLPRYRFNEGTGKWNKESTKPKPVEGNKTTDPNAFESSYDYFLRRNYAVEKKDSTEKKLNDEKNDTMKKISQFEEQHLSEEKVPLGKRGVSTTYVVKDDPHNPILGFLSGVSLGTIYNALTSIKGGVSSPFKTFTSEMERQRTYMAFEDFHEFLSLVRSSITVSEEYEQDMYTRLTMLYPNQKMTTYDLFSYLVNHTLHKNVDLAVEMIFLAFDTDKRGIIPVEALHPRVLEAWAEENTFGNLRDSWLKLAEALRQEEQFLGNNMIAGTPFLDPDSLRALLCSSDALFAVANRVDLEGGERRAKSTRK